MAAPPTPDPLTGIENLLRGRRALVTGAASGIGAAVARAFREAGAEVIGADLAAADGIASCDVRSEQDVVDLFAGPARDVTDVVHAAGIARLSPLAETSLEHWRSVIDTNLTGSFLIGREVARRFQTPGSLTFLASVGGIRGSARAGPYGPSKFGVVGLARSLGRELAPRRIRVNAICPGGVESPMSAETVRRDAIRLGRTEEQVRAEAYAEVPIGRWADVEEVAGVCVFLASGLAAHVTGASLLVDGAISA
jgi:NAD(P)-dependent dehydrogenase (short-subunit alcohol dehydrogenase family)